MKINLFKNSRDLIELTDSEIKSLVENTIAKFCLTDNLEIEIMFVEPSVIQELNYKHRKINNPTDVLSFPQDQFEVNVERKILGSLVISQKITKDKDESLEQVIKHGVLHLLGYDHETDETAWNDAAAKINCTL